jgi:hypothetical protein
MAARFMIAEQRQQQDRRGNMASSDLRERAAGAAAHAMDVRRRSSVDANHHCLLLLRILPIKPRTERILREIRRRTRAAGVFPGEPTLLSKAAARQRRDGMVNT